ncbi:hypothetical protein RND71_030169 [Anisodus tanguticus]|uniref:Fe2OG dioxygenase domain-containing protein n=1 Tax=Anisodus tanguticus TaxID=243964 RepID=A0AAE1RGY4_9SOLA|nr:hypothetical protein RND71_030169 [Anisodus tanguticus]
MDGSGGGWIVGGWRRIELHPIHLRSIASPTVQGCRGPQVSKLNENWWTESLYFAVRSNKATKKIQSLRVSGPDFFASAQSTCQALINQPIPEFSHAMEVYGSNMEKLSKSIIEVILMSLGPELEQKFASEFKNCHGYLRVNNYSPPENTKNVQEEEVEGLGMHTDMSCITIVYQDEVGGLQVRSKEGKWMNIDPCQDTLVVNVGDLLQAWSNGKLRSSEHRVVLKEHVSRFSIAFFWCFEDEKLIVAPEEIVGNGNLRVYKPFVCADYLKFRESNEKGKFEKVGFTVKHFAGK